GKCEEAVPQYGAFLSLALRADEARRPPATAVLPMMFGLAFCQAQLNRPTEAEKTYESVRTLAAQIGDKSMESTAAVNEAQLKATRQQIPEALALYQQAIRLDRTQNDPHAEGQDWYNYGIFLRDHSFPAQLSYACLLRSELLLSVTKESAELKQVSLART